jgi:hypothetical protein
VVKKGQLESHLLVLVTLALVAFGLVMVYSARPHRRRSPDRPMSYTEEQAIYAFIGVGLMMAASRFDYRRLRHLAPGSSSSPWAVVCSCSSSAHASTAHAAGSRSGRRTVPAVRARQARDRRLGGGRTCA